MDADALDIVVEDEELEDDETSQLYEHHRIVVGIVRLTGQSAVHIKDRNAVLFRNKTGLVLWIGHLGHIVP